MGHFILCPSIWHLGIWNTPKTGCDPEQMYLKLTLRNFSPSTSSLDIPDDFSSGGAL